MPTSAPGSRPGSAAPRPGAAPRGRGFTLLELLVVLAIIAISVATVSLALRDGSATRLEREAVRLATLLEVARTEARVSGVPVVWVPGADPRALTPDGQPAHFRFIGLPPRLALPSRWLDPRVTAEVLGRPSMSLGPDAILPPQRVVLRLDDQRLDVVTDGLSPFAIAASPAAVP